MPNWFATFALCSWPFIAIYLFSTQALGRAIIWTVLGAQLLLPVGTAIKFEMIPQLDKNSIPSFCILIGCFIRSRSSLKFWRGLGLVEALIFMNLVGPIITSLLNKDDVLNGRVIMPG